jgi:hypothetical protein
MDQVDDPALADHRVVVEVLLQPLPELQRKLIEGFVPIQQVVRPDDRGVAAHVAAAEVTLFQDRDPGLAEFLGEVVGRGEAVAAAADDDIIVFGPGVGVAPDGFPALVASKSLGNDPKSGIAHRHLQRLTRELLSKNQSYPRQIPSQTVCFSPLAGILR